MEIWRLAKKLEKKPVFSVQDAQRVAGCSREYAKVLVHRLLEKGMIKRVTRNRYTTLDDIWVIASNLHPPSYISFWSASYLLGYTEQIVNTVQLATPRKNGKLEFQGYGIKFIPIKQFFGYRKERTKHGDLFIVENEKLLIDAFLRPSELGNFDEILNVFRNAEIDEKKILEYLQKAGKDSITKRVGYLLEKLQGIDLREHFELDRNYINLDPFNPRWKTIDKKWRVRV